MNSKRASQVLAVAAPHLKAGELVELATFAKVGSVSVKRKVTTTAAVAALTGGLVIVSVSARGMYIAMTGRRLLFFDGHTASGRPGQKVLMSIPRELIQVAETKNGLVTLKAELAVDGQEKGLRLTFPRPCREDGGQLISALRNA